MENIDIAIIKSSFENLDKLNDRIYFEAQKEGYHHLTTQTEQGIQRSLYIFKELKNPTFIENLLNGYEYLNDATIYFGKVIQLKKYIATEYTGKPTRIKLIVDNDEIYDVPEIARDHLNIQL